MLELIAKSPASAPPVIANVSVSAGTSSSVAVTVVTAVVFSATLTAAVAPPPSLVITGASLASVIVTLIVLHVVQSVAIVDCDLNFIDAIQVGIGWRFKILAADQSQHAGAGIDREIGRVGAAGDRVSQRVGWQVGICCRHRGDCRRVFGHIDCGRCAAAVAGNRGRFIDIGDRDTDRLGRRSNRCHRRP